MPKKSSTVAPEGSATVNGPAEMTSIEPPSSETALGPQSSTTAIGGTEMTPGEAELGTTTGTGQHSLTAAQTAHGHLQPARKAVQDRLSAGVAAAQTIPGHVRSAGQAVQGRLAAGAAAIKRAATNLITDYVLVKSCDEMKTKADCNRACLGRRTEKGVEALVGEQAAVRCQWTYEPGAPINDARACEKGTANCLAGMG